MTHTRKAFFFIGFPCAGKSTIASFLTTFASIQGSPLVTVSSDNILEGIKTSLNETCSVDSLKLTYNDLFNAGAYTHASKLMVKFLDLVSSMKDEPHVIWDQVNLTKKKRTSSVRTLKQKGFDEVVAVWVNTPLEVCKERNLTNLDRQGKLIPEEVYDTMEEGFSKPELSEGFSKIIEFKDVDISKPMDSLKELLEEIK